MISPWAHAINNDKADKLRNALGGVRLVQYPGNYSQSRDNDVAYVGNPEKISTVLEHRPWRLIICGDERNMDGLSGSYETPTEYAKKWREAFKVLNEENIPFTTKGLAIVNGGFDHSYHKEMTRLAPAPIRAVNCRTWYWPSVRNAMEKYGGRWSVTLLPIRAAWFPLQDNTIFAFLRQHFTAPFGETLNKVLEHPQVMNVGVWCLREVRMGDGRWQSWHGLFDRKAKMTWQAREVRKRSNR